MFDPARLRRGVTTDEITEPPDTPTEPFDMVEAFTVDGPSRAEQVRMYALGAAIRLAPKAASHTILAYAREYERWILYGDPQ